MRINALNPDEKQVFGKLQKEGPMTKKSLISCFDYKTSTLNRLISSLLEKKAVVEYGQEESSGGRKPSLFDVNVNEKYLIGIEISRTYSYVTLCDLKMKVKAGERIFVSVDKYYPEILVDEIAGIVNRFLEKFSITKESILGAGLGMVGPIDRNTGYSGEVSDFVVDAWSNIPIRDMLERALGCAVYVDNGTYAAVLAEYLYGDGRKNKNISYFNCGIGIRSAHITSGVIIRSAFCEEDAFAHTSIAVLGGRCKCGKTGCLGLYASTRVITENIRRRIKAGESSLIKVPLNEINYLHYRAAAEQGDVISREELRNAGFYMGIGLGNYITLLNPERVVISGPLVMETPFFYDAVVKTALENIYQREKAKVIFKRGGSFGIETIAVGAAAMFFECYMGNPIME